MIIRNFEYLLALHREEHYGRAAERCHVSQPTLSAGIRQLEEDMDIHIVRHGRRYDGLTPAGMRILAWAQRMESDCNEMRRELSSLQSGLEGSFKFGVLPGTSAVAPILSVALANKTPLLEQSIATFSSSKLLKAIKSRHLDIALMYLDDLGEDDVDTHMLYRERMFLFKSEGTSLPRSVDWDYVMENRLCMLNAAVPNRLNEELDKTTTQVLHTDSMDILASHVATGNYATVLPQSLASRLAHLPNIQALALPASVSHANVGFVAPSKTLCKDPTQVLIDLAHSDDIVNAIRSVLAIHRRLRPK